MKKRIRRRTKRRLILFSLLAVCTAIGVTVCVLGAPHWRAAKRVETLKTAAVPAWVQAAYIDEGGARSGHALADFTGVVVHYVGNPGTTAMGNRNYFNQPTTEVVSHFVIGLDGEVVQCLPLHERSVASNSRNRDTVSIEVCHPDESGVFNDATYASLVRLTAWLCELGELDTAAVIRHYDVTGKECPLYYVRNPEAWQAFLSAVENARN
ncbi:MAG: N-acetylmuramoyl-L-alanine amidase [Clostridia bacterium]|nr:N-acetylmuramoyl-L-alanine amidase [Clostridia bacterium]